MRETQFLNRRLALAERGVDGLLLVGLVVAGSPRLGLLLTPLVPLAAGWGLVGLSLGRVVEESRAGGGLSGLTARENEVLDLMAEGLSNQAISDRLHLSLKTVEPAVSSIFTKLGLPADAGTNRRVLAVRALLERRPPTQEEASTDVRLR